MKNYSFFLFVSILFFENTAFPQTFGVGGGISIVEGPGAYKEAPGGLGLSTGYHLDLKLKIDTPSFPVTPVGFFTFYDFKGRVYRVTEKIWSVGIGAEYKIIRGALSPYLALDFAYNHSDLEFNTGGAEIGTPDIKIKAKIGAAIGIGTELNIIPLSGIDVNIKYHLVNCAVQETNEESLKVLSCSLAFLF